MKKSITTLLAAVALAMLPLLAHAQYEGTRFIMHISGLHLAKSEASGILEAADAANPQKMTVTKTSDGFYTIQAPDGTYLSQGGGNAWNTMFVANAGSSNKAKFTFEQDGNLVKIKNRDTGKYLGVDAVNDPGTWVFIDKDGKSSMHTWFFSDDVNAKVPTTTYNLIVNPAAERQMFEGWGISLCWWANMIGRGGNWTEAKVDEVVEWLTSPEYLNYNVFRYNIGGGDDPEHRNCNQGHMRSGKGERAEMPGFKMYEDSDYDWDADSAQTRILLKIKEKRPDAIFEAFSNSAPWWMTNSGCTAGAKNAGSDNMNPEYYEAFAHYLVDVCKHYKEAYGIEFATLSPFNEPSTNFWGCNGGQEGCHWSTTSMSNFMKVLAPVIKESGLNIKIAGPEEWDIATSVKDFKAFQNSGALECMGQINTHTYSANDKARNQLSALCADYGIRLVMSEVGVGGSGFEGNLQLAQKIIDDIRYIQPAIWTDWQYMEEGNDQWCMVQCGFKSAVYRRVNNFYMHQHFTKYIKPGYTFLTSTNSRTLAARNAEGDSLVIVAINPDAIDCDFSMDLSAYKSVSRPETALSSTANSYFNPFDYELADKTLSFTLPGLTIVTFVIPVEADPAFKTNLADGEKYLILPRNAADLAITGVDRGAQLAPIDCGDNQVWTLSVSNGHTQFTNQSGLSLTATSDYALSLTGDEAVGVKSFTITPVGAACYKIEAEVDGAKKSFDLEGEGSSAGTKVGMWDYGTDPAGIHRQFHLVRIYDATNAIKDMLAEGKSSKAATFATADGALCIMQSTEGQGFVTVYTLDGRVAYSGVVSDAATMVPLPRGVYAVGYARGSEKASQIVTVK